MQALTYNEWLRSKEGQQDVSTILASCSSIYPDIFQMSKQLRIAYQEYKRKFNESKSKY